MYIFYRAWECRVPLTQCFLLGLRHPGSWKNSLVSRSCRLVIHPRAACRGWEQAEEILPPVSRYVWSSAQLPACRHGLPASPPGRSACAARSLSGTRMDTFRAWRRGLHFLQAGLVCPCAAARLWLRQTVWAPRMPLVLAIHSATGTPYSWMPNNPGG